MCGNVLLSHPMDSSPGDITRLLNRSGVSVSTDEQAVNLLYTELRKIASAMMAGERRDHTLQPTAVASEAYMQLVDPRHHNWESRAQFFAAAAHAMRHILVDYSRKKHSQKRGGNLQRVDLDQADRIAIAADDDLLGLDEALTRLERHAEAARARERSSQLANRIADTLLDEPALRQSFLTRVQRDLAAAQATSQ